MYKLPNQTMSLHQWGMLIVLSLVWGASFFLIAVALEDLPPLTLVWLRLAIAASLLWLVVSMRSIAVPRRPQVWLAFLFMGLFNNAIPFALITWGQTHIPSALASILNATTPLWTVLVAGLFLADERFSISKVSGVICGVVGVAVMIGGALTVQASHLPGQLAVIGAAFAYAIAAVFGRRFARWGISPLLVAAGMTSASTLELLPLVLWLESPLSLAMPAWQSLAAVLVLGTVSTAFAYILYFRLLASAGATNLALVTLLVPVWAIVLGVLILNEALKPTHFIGMFLIAVGLAAIDGRVWRAVLHRRVAGSRGERL